MDLTIAEIANACSGELVVQNAQPDEQVSGVVLDSRQVTAGGVFIATVGERVDGHRFIGDVFAKGAALVVTEKTPEETERACDVPVGAWGTYLVVEDSFRALRDIAEYYRQKLTIPIVGITGSVGKTSTKELIAGVLSQRYRVLKTEGNYNNEIGVPLTLLRIREEHEAAVVEMGISEFGEMHRLSKIARPDICVITNIGQCHLENLGSRDGILRAKTEIFDYMPVDARVCLNGEDDKLRTVERAMCGKCLHEATDVSETPVPGVEPIYFGLGNQACESVYADGIESRGLWGSDAVMHLGEESFPVRVPLPGAHMVLNAAAAACVARVLGLTAKEIAAGIRALQPVDGRGHLIRLARGTVIDDCYNANPASMKAALELLDMADTVKVAILGDMFEMGADSDELHREVGRYAAASGADTVLCVGENARFLYETAKGAAGKAVRYYETREQLLAALDGHREELLPNGCTVLVKASHGMKFAEVVEWLRNVFN